MNTLPIALPLTPDACPDASDRRLALEVSESSIAVLVPGSGAESDCIYAEIALDADSSQYLHAVEEAVYANPMLLCDFRSVTVLLRGRNTLVQPHGFGSWLPAADGMEVLSEGIASPGVEVVADYPSELLKFLRRSFSNPYIGNHMSRLCSFLGLLSRRSNRQRAYLQYRGAATDVLIYSGGALQFAASFRVTSPDDALYYALAACDTAGFDRSEGEMMLVAPAPLRDSLQPLLRRYVNYVMPLIIPADLCRQAPLELALAARPNSHN